ncbi:MAG: zf-HC2 domain-containing protein [Planctomycetota bacterium]
MRDELLNPADTECATIRRLMLTAQERDLSDFEAARVERHVNECRACTEILEGTGDATPSEAPGQRFVPTPSEEEWARVKAGIWSDLGLDRGMSHARPRTTVARPSAGNGASVPRAVAGGEPAPPASLPRTRLVARLWRFVGPAAAGLAIGWLMFHQPSSKTPGGDPGGDPSSVPTAIAAEILELGDGQDFVILTGDDEDGVVILMTTSG